MKKVLIIITLIGIGCSNISENNSNRNIKLSSKTETRTTKYFSHVNTIDQISYITNRDGSWLKESIEGTNIVFLDFNTEIRLVKSCMPAKSTAWYYVNSKNGNGWISGYHVGRKWCPDDKELLNSAKNLLLRIKSKEPIEPLMNDKWNLIYHAEDRCDGTTEGKIIDLPKNRIDTINRIKVFRDGEGWLECDIDTATYFKDFKLQIIIDEWSVHGGKLEILDIDHCNKTIELGMEGSSQYFEIILKKSTDSYLIISVGYMLIDPG